MGAIPEEIILIDDDVWEMAEITMAPILPKTEFKVGKTTYSITDFTYLNEYAKRIFNCVLQKAYNAPLGKSVCFEVPNEVTDESLRIATKIIGSIFYKVKRKGRNGFSEDGTFLIHGVWTYVKKDGSRTIELDIDEKLAMSIYEYAQKRKSEGVLQVSLNELVAEVLNPENDESYWMLRKLLESEIEERNETDRH